MEPVFQRQGAAPGNSIDIGQWKARIHTLGNVLFSLLDCIAIVSSFKHVRLGVFLVAPRPVTAVVQLFGSWERKDVVQPSVVANVACSVIIASHRANEMHCDCPVRARKHGPHISIPRPLVAQMRRKDDPPESSRDCGLSWYRILRFVNLMPRYWCCWSKM